MFCNRKKADKLFGGFTALCMAVTLLFIPCTVTAHAADPIDSLKQKQAEYAQQKQENDSKLAKLRQDKDKKNDYKNTLENQISTLQNQIDTYNEQIQELDTKILKTQDEIADKQKNISANTARLKKRLCALYMSGGASNLEILLSADSVYDFADKVEALQMVTAHDTSLIHLLKSEMASVKKQKTAIKQNRQAAADAKTSVSEKQGELSGFVREAQGVINDMSAKESSLQSASDDFAQKEEAASQAIDKWYADYQASQEKKKVELAQKQASQQQKSVSAKTVGSSSVAASTSGGASAIGSGSMVWPVPSCQVITTYFGQVDEVHSHPHKGVDIGASYGSTIVAPDSGTVVMAGAGAGYEGYGNVVAIDHGNGLISLCAHMSSVAVSSGQTVAKGQVIGYVGSTGHSTGPHCHFEVRLNGTPVNPMNYV